jgi:hypothetical protein
VSPRNEGFGVYIARFDELLWLQQEAEHGHLNARWSSRDALVRQVEPGSTAILAPALRHGDDYRCHIWFARRGDPGNRVASLFDATPASLGRLRTAARADQLLAVVRMLLDGMSLVPIE